jgi:Zn-dependent protease with chaperone function
VAPEAFSRLSVDLLCENASPEIQSLCTTNQHLNLMRAGAFWAGIVGLTLLLVIRLAGTVARTNRWFLLYLFKPGLYLTVLLLVGLILVHAAVAMAALYYGESILAGRIHVFIIGAIGLGALIGILDMVSNAFALVQKVQTRVLGKIVSREQASALWQHVEDIAERLGALHPQHIVVGLDPNFFVTEADVVCLDGTLSGRTLYCSLPLCRILTTQEFSAIIGHELGHYKGQDTRFSQRFFPVYRGTIASILALHQQSDSHGARVIALLPAVAVLNYFLECFAVAEHRISRDRELVADQEGVTASDRDSMTSALVKVHAFAGYWQALETAIAEALHQGNMYANTSRMFAKVVALQATSETLQDIGATHLTHPTDTHPPLSPCASKR